jgi:hypothetical protein
MPATGVEDADTGGKLGQSEALGVAPRTRFSPPATEVRAAGPDQTEQGVDVPGIDK